MDANKEGQTEMVLPAYALRPPLLLTSNKYQVNETTCFVFFKGNRKQVSEV